MVEESMDRTAEGEIVSVELSDEDKLLIMELVINQYFGEGCSVDSKTVECNFSPVDEASLKNTTTSIDNKTTEKYENSFGSEEDLSREERQSIIRDLVKKFFSEESKEQTRNEFDTSDDGNKLDLPPEEENHLMVLINAKRNNKEDKSKEEIESYKSINNANQEQPIIDIPDDSIPRVREAPTVNTEETTSIGLSALEEAEINRIICLAEREKVKEHVCDKSIEILHSETQNCHYKSSTPLMTTRENSKSKAGASLNKFKINLNLYTEFRKNDGQENKKFAKCDKVDESDEEKIESLSVKWEQQGDGLHMKTIKKAYVKNTSQYLGGKCESSKYTKINKHKYKFDCLRTKCPMNDKDSPFFIDKDKVDVPTYQDGLRLSRWNPTQVLYEICTQCQWPAPVFFNLDYSTEKGFLCGVVVNDCKFIPRERSGTKREAKHHASSHLLRYLGFKFIYESPKDLRVTFTKLHSWTTEGHTQAIKRETEAEAVDIKRRKTSLDGSIECRRDYKARRNDQTIDGDKKHDLLKRESSCSNKSINISSATQNLKDDLQYTKNCRMHRCVERGEDCKREDVHDGRCKCRLSTPSRDRKLDSSSSFLYETTRRRRLYNEPDTSTYEGRASETSTTQCNQSVLAKHYSFTSRIHSP